MKESTTLITYLRFAFSEYQQISGIMEKILHDKQSYTDELQAMKLTQGQKDAVYKILHEWEAFIKKQG
jgi:hypothetical protein